MWNISTRDLMGMALVIVFIAPLGFPKVPKAIMEPLM